MGRKDGLKIVKIGFLSHPSQYKKILHYNMNIYCNYIYVNIIIYYSMILFRIINQLYAVDALKWKLEYVPHTQVHFKYQKIK